MIRHTENHKAAANWVMGDVRSWMNDKGLAMADYPVSAEGLAALVRLIDEGGVSHTTASQKLLPLMLSEPGVGPRELAERNHLLQVDASDQVTEALKAAMERFPDKVAAYRAGNKGLLGLFMGEVMKATKGKADPRKANELVRRMLEADNA